MPLSVLHLVAGLQAAPVAMAAAPRALLVAVSAPAGGDWPRLAADADVALLAPVVTEAGAAVRVLSGPGTTPEAVLAGVQEHLGAAGPGGHVWLHVSSHGTRVRDADGDEADGWDEALVLHPSGGRGSELLLDDALFAALLPLRRTLGPAGSVAVTVDACHGAGALRGPGGEARGGPAWGWAAESAAADAGLAPLVVLSGAREDEQAQDVRGPDGRPVGAFSLALAETLAGGAGTWAEVHAAVRYRVSARVRGQRPVLSGAGETPLLGRAGTAPVGGGRVVQRIDADRVRIDRGWLHGVEVADRVRLSVGDASVEGVVRAVGLSDARVEAPVGALPEGAARVALVARGPGHRLRVSVHPDAPGAADLRAAIAREPLLVLAASPSEADAWLDADGGAGPWAWRDAQDLRARALRERVARLSIASAGRRVAPTLVSAQPGSCRQAEAVPRAIGGEAVVRVGETVGLQLRHDGEHAAYVTVLHEDARGRLQQLAPAPGEAHLPRQPGDAWSVEGCWRVAPPVGAETLHVLASRTPVDLRPVLRGGASPAGVLDAVSVSAVELAVLPSVGAP